MVVKSTVVPGTTDGLVRERLEAGSGKRVGEEIGLGMNPEFLTEGQAVRDFMNPDRIVIGGVDDSSHSDLARVFARFTDTEKFFTNNKTAELIKYASNALLASMISYSNELAGLAARLGEVDITEVLAGVHASSYLTTREAGRPAVKAGITSFLGAGCGFGGSCLPKDVKALAAQGMDLGLPMRMLNSVIEINDAQADEMLNLIRAAHSSLIGPPDRSIGGSV